MSTHERVIRGLLHDADVYDEQIDGILAYIEAVAGQTPPRPDTEQHEPLSLADSKPAEQPERREVWAVWRDDGKFYGSFTIEGNARVTANRINGTCCLMRGVLPGDPSPETIAEVVRQLRMVDSSPPASSKYLNKLADKLEGK